jgi:RNA polymerase sigma-70 factor (ECF subfamily)
VLVSVAYKQVRKAVEDLPMPPPAGDLSSLLRRMTYRDVAKGLGIPEGTATWRLRGALHRIGEQLTAEGFEDANLE